MSGCSPWIMETWAFSSSGGSVIATPPTQTSVGGRPHQTQRFLRGILVCQRLGPRPFGNGSELIGREHRKSRDQLGEGAEMPALSKALSCFVPTVSVGGIT